MSDLIAYRPPMIEEHQATSTLAELYEEVKRETASPSVPNLIKTIAVSEPALRVYIDFYSSFMRNTTFPQSLIAMIGYVIAEQSRCEYCSSANELACRTLGIDEETLANIARDMDSVNPERIRLILEFALKAAKHPRDLVSEDYTRLHEQGISEAEVVEIILIAGLATINDIFADALKADVDEAVNQALGR
jgi:uncharacterized peroxidase-related enzyme